MEPVDCPIVNVAVAIAAGVCAILGGIEGILTGGLISWR